MPKLKIAVTIDEALLCELDKLVADEVFPSRSSAIESAVKLAQKAMRRKRLLRELDKISPEEEIALAEEFETADIETWPEY